MKFNVILMLFCAVLSFSSPQIKAQSPDGGGHYEHSKTQCISDALRLETENMIQANRTVLLAKGIMKEPKKTRVALAWPLQQIAGSPYCSYYGISNFVDHDANYPNQLKDFNCGTRTYDLASGYNHGGMDIFLWPFDWNMVGAQQVEVIAAAPGTIVAKYDGNTDMNCDFSNPNWNAIFVEHADGTVAWYGHMKNGSLNAKNVGATVVAGEKLGVVASSGSSTGPHLHFELHDAGNNVIDPFAGACNPGGTNLWAPARSYHDPAVNAAFTHSAPPVYNPCPNTHVTNQKDTFYASDDIYFMGYFHDQLTNISATYTVKRPDNSTFATWNHTPPVYYSASYWYWQYTLPSNPMYGTWNYSITMNGQTCNHPFEVPNPAAVGIVNVTDSKILLKIVPNPALHTVTITGAESGIEIFDVQGKLLNTYMNNTNIDISDYANGMYFIKSGTQVQKLVISH